MQGKYIGAGILASAVIIALLLTAGIAALSIREYRAFNQALENRAFRIRGALSEAVEKKLHAPRDLVLALSERRDFMAAAGAMDRERFLDAVSPFVRGDVRFITVHDARGVVLARADGPETLGEADELKALAAEVLETGRIASTILLFEGRLAAVSMKRLTPPNGPPAAAAAGHWFDQPFVNDFAKSFGVEMEITFGSSISVSSRRRADARIGMHRETEVTFPGLLGADSPFAATLFMEAGRGASFWYLPAVLIFLIVIAAVAGVFAFRRIAADAAISMRNARDRLKEQKAELHETMAERTENLIWTNRKLKREIAERKRAEAELKEHRDQLEHTISERTAEVVKTNAELQREIGERKRVEKDLRETSSILETIFDAITDIIGLQNHNHKVIRYNAAGYRYLNKTHEEVVGGKCYEAIGRDAPCEVCAAKICLRTKKPASLEKYVEERDVWLDARAYPILDGDGRITGVIEHLRDITVSKKSEEARRKINAELEQQNRFLEAFLSAIPNPLFFKDVQGRYLGCNEAFSDMLDMTADEIKGKLLHEVWPAGHAEKYHEKDLELIRHQEKQVFEWMIANKTGENRNFIISKDVFRDEKGEVAGLVGVYVDITDVKSAREEMDRLRNLLSNIIDSMPSVLIAVDPSMRVTQWNLEAERVTGVTAQEARGGVLPEVFPGLSGEKGKIERTIADGEPRSDEKVPWGGDGGARFSDVTIYPLTANGVGGAVIRVDDVTERARMEEMMVQSEKMLSVGGLAAGMAHEINNPLAGLLQNVQVMRNRIKADLPKNRRAAEALGLSMEDVERFMEQRGMYSMMASVLQSGRRAARIVDNMLSFSRGGKAVASIHDLAVLLDKTIELAENDYDLKKKYDFRSIEITRDYDPDAPLAPCEGGNLQQVFLNIIKNGAQALASREDPSSPARLVLRVKRDGEDVRVEIEDNGPGMDESVRKRIFEPFFTTREVGDGAGLGLSSSYFIVTRNHGGSLSAASKPGEGARFIITLPTSPGN